MNINAIEDLDSFFSGHLIVNKDRKITFCNDYICGLGEQPQDTLVNSSISNCFTKASGIFIESYIYPRLLKESVVQESQMSWRGQHGQIIPVVVNIKLGKEGSSFWSIYECSNRDKLYNELIEAKEKLEEQSRELYQLATTDPLTGLLNRREMSVQVKKLTSQVARNSSTYALLSIDVDLFKQVNDAYGHSVGDDVLKKLANILIKDRRANDVVARVGGEEFILVLADIDDENAFIFAETLRKNIETQSIDNISITVSIGLVVSHKKAKVDFDFLLNLSDKALFDAKKAGRNRTTVGQY
ncbi:MAG: diguanylate cyclase (GGDEF)-like protein [Paraglaciecola sp.]|jgi:diguanylate cyclase (GGDEF)-like protein